jgi:hypothetical protein
MFISEETKTIKLNKRAKALKCTCDVRDFITSFAALDFEDSSATSVMASCTFLADLCSSSS